MRKSIECRILNRKYHEKFIRHSTVRRDFFFSSLEKRLHIIKQKKKTLGILIRKGKYEVCHFRDNRYEHLYTMQAEDKMKVMNITKSQEMQKFVLQKSSAFSQNKLIKKDIGKEMKLERLKLKMLTFRLTMT